ncbi:carbohydrate ABC transporter permease [Oceaniovalibus sp. ACAM 378]|jgi:multiple sugar transport system permease protein|uniref:carbohydrate ABC transporter permease n=1 Tax=Oceaniovalibus sp. ACAM 378 TaxID=2599923 RepID=UPI0011DBAFF2|nr:sugar ABC transporter permease [Oceaniovalibus sp. ACAM 378]TYB90788.1 sugar ABC transporter permease [Oceaniovalibus sp. ACAM 378]
MSTRVNRRTLLAFLGPSVFALLAVGVVPLAYAVWKSFYYFNLTKLSRSEFIGLDNYATVLTSGAFWGAMGRTAMLFITAVPIQIAIGLCIALVLHRPGLTLFKTLTRLALVLPMATTYAVVGLLAQVMMNQKYGVFNQMFGWIGIDPINIIGDPTNAFIGVVFWDIWQWTPFVALVLLAGLTTVPPEIEEAARLETKSNWIVLRHVQLPFLIPSLVAVLILRTADTLKLFDMPFTMTRGGPGNATEFIAVLIERIGNRQFDIGLAAAHAIIMLAITVVLARIYISLFYKDVR